MTRFNANQIVQATESVQGLVKGATYEITSVNAQETPFGTFVTYTVQPTSSPTLRNYKPLFIVNGHFFLKEAV